jgi:hypothetical protein
MTPNNGPWPLEVQFTDLSTNSPNVWAWDFGDGTTSMNQNPSHTYDSSGFYTVTLIAHNDNGSDSETKTHCIVVTANTVSILPWYVVYAYTTTTYTNADSTWRVDAEGNTWPNWEPVLHEVTAADQPLWEVTWDTLDGYGNPYRGTMRLKFGGDPAVLDSFLIDAHLTEVGGWATRHVVLEGFGLPNTTAAPNSLLWRVEGLSACNHTIVVHDSLNGSGGGITQVREITSWECNESSRVELSVIELD